MLRAISKDVLYSKARFVRWINLDSIEKYAWTEGDKSYTFQAYGLDEAWPKLLPFFAKGYAHSTLSKRYLPDAEKREEFFYLYFRHKYEASYNDGRGGANIGEVHEVIDGKERSKLIYAGIGVFDTNCRDADPTEMMNFDKEMTKNVFSTSTYCTEHKKLHFAVEC